MLDGKEDLLLLDEPVFSLIILAFRAVTILTGVETVMEGGAVIAEIDLPARSFGATALDVGHDATVGREHALAEFGKVVRAVQTEDVRYLRH